MATGTGKTYTAAQIIWRFMEYFRTINPGKRQACVLFLADRNILIDQTMMNDIAMFKGRMAKLSMSSGTISNVANPDVPEGADTKIVDKSFRAVPLALPGGKWHRGHRQCLQGKRPGRQCLAGHHLAAFATALKEGTVRTR